MDFGGVANQPGKDREGGGDAPPDLFLQGEEQDSGTGLLSSGSQEKNLGTKSQKAIKEKEKEKKNPKTSPKVSQEVPEANPPEPIVKFYTGPAMLQPTVDGIDEAKKWINALIELAKIGYESESATGAISIPRFRNHEDRSGKWRLTWLYEACLHHALHEFLQVRKQIVWRPKETWLHGSGITSQFDIQQWIMWKRFPSFNWIHGRNTHNFLSF